MAAECRVPPEQSSALWQRFCRLSAGYTVAIRSVLVPGALSTWVEITLKERGAGEGPPSIVVQRQSLFDAALAVLEEMRARGWPTSM